MSVKSTRIEISLSDALSALKSHGLVLKSSENLFPLLSSTKQLLEVVVDSRQATAASIFIAIRGTKFDGHHFIKTSDPSKLGIAIIDDASQIPSQIPYILTKSSRASWSVLAAFFFNYPQRNLKLIGVTGTNGKTSTVWYVRELLRAQGVKCASIGTLGLALDGDFEETGHTTPDPPVLFAAFARCVENSIDFVAMEVSSQALIQDKVFGCEFIAGGFTSFSRDHLDAHGTMENYFAAKMLFFNLHLKSGAAAVVHSSLKTRFDSSLKNRVNSLFYMYHNTEIPKDSGETIEVTSKQLEEVKFPMVEITTRSKKIEGRCPVYGVPALENFCCAVTLITAATMQPVLPDLWENLKPVPGRFEPVSGSAVGGPRVFVDYAHTPDALEKILAEGRKLLTRTGHLVVVFGCGGDRDAGKRAPMGEIASRMADRIFLTSDNPRTEDPESICQEIMEGIPKSMRGKLETIVDRTRAITEAITSSQAQDVVILAGKGHEDYQEIMGVKRHLDDREIARSVLHFKR